MRTVTPAAWVGRLERSALQRMLETAAAPDLLSFSLGLPAPDLFPSDELARAVRETLPEVRTLQYGLPSARLRGQIAALMHARGIDCTEDEIFLTSGAQQGIQLLTQYLLEPGGRVVADAFAYTGFLQAIESLAPTVLAVPRDPVTGPDLRALDHALGSDPRPGFFYTIADGHNPLSTSLTASQRQALVDAARFHRVPIVEDGAYAWLQYGDTPARPLAALDRESVLYIGSFSKVLGPSLRVGWIVAPPPVIAKLSILKEAMDICTATFAQHVVSRFLEHVSFLDHLAGMRRAYRVRRDAMLEALRLELGDGGRWSVPECGFFVWVDVPGIDSTELLRHSLADERIAFVPGPAFSADGAPRGGSCLRLSFSHAPLERMRDGVARLVRLTGRSRGRAAARGTAVGLV